MPNCTVFFYGSTLEGNTSKFPDIDLVLDYYGSPVPDGMVSKLSMLFEESMHAYSVDILDINKVLPFFEKRLIEISRGLNV